MESVKKRYDYIDLLKCFAIFCIISIHIPLFDYDLASNAASDILQYSLKILTQTVPLFFAINGFLLLEKKELDLKKHAHRLIKLLGLFVFWSLLLILINLLFDKTVFNDSVVIDLFLKTTSGSLYTGELWFLQALFSIYLIYPIIWYIYNNNIKLYKYFFIILVIFNFSIHILNVSTILLDNQIRINQINDLIMLINRFNISTNYSWFLMYFMLGGLINKYIDLIKKNRTIIMLISIIAYATVIILSCRISIRDNCSLEFFDSNSTIFSFIYVILCFAVACNYQKANNASDILLDIGANTLGIYITHSFFLRLSRLLIPQEFILLRLLTTILTLVICYLFTKVMKRIPFVKRLFSI